MKKKLLKIIQLLIISGFFCIFYFIITIPREAKATNQVRVFVTSGVYQSDFAKTDSINKPCQDAATSAGLSGTWLPLLAYRIASGSVSSSYSAKYLLIPKDDTNFIRLDGKIIALSGWDLFDSSIINPININEKGILASGSQRNVFTGFKPSGGIYINEWGNPAPIWFNSTGDSSIMGNIDAIDSQWAQVGMAGGAGNYYHLYCFDGTSIVGHGTLQPTFPTDPSIYGFRIDQPLVVKTKTFITIGAGGSECSSGNSDCPSVKYTVLSDNKVVSTVNSGYLLTTDISIDLNSSLIGLGEHNITIRATSNSFPEVLEVTKAIKVYDPIFCGDGIVEDWEVCDDGRHNDDFYYGSCSPTCDYINYVSNPITSVLINFCRYYTCSDIWTLNILNGQDQGGGTTQSTGNAYCRPAYTYFAKTVDGTNKGGPVWPDNFMRKLDGTLVTGNNRMVRGVSGWSGWVEAADYGAGYWDRIGGGTQHPLQEIWCGPADSLGSNPLTPRDYMVYPESPGGGAADMIFGQFFHQHGIISVLSNVADTIINVTSTTDSYSSTVTTAYTPVTVTIIAPVGSYNATCPDKTASGYYPIIQPASQNLTSGNTITFACIYAAIPCSNGATNPPTCTTCSSNMAKNSNGICVACNGGCTNNLCNNGATNPPYCSNCAVGKYMISGSCQACPVNNHWNGSICISDTQPCNPMPANAIAGTQTWNSSTSTLDACVITSCATTYHLSGGACISDTGTINVDMRTNPGGGNATLYKQTTYTATPPSGCYNNNAGTWCVTVLSTGDVKLIVSFSNQPFGSYIVDYWPIPTNYRVSPGFYDSSPTYQTLSSNGQTITFTPTYTLGAPTVTTTAATSVTVSSATLNGSANPNGNTTTAWFRYSTANPGTCNTTFGTLAGGTTISLGGGTITSFFSKPIVSLTDNTTYYFCAIAASAMGTGFGGVLSFTTLSFPAGNSTFNASVANAAGAGTGVVVKRNINNSNLLTAGCGAIPLDCGVTDTPIRAGNSIHLSLIVNNVNGAPLTSGVGYNTWTWTNTDTGATGNITPPIAGFSDWIVPQSSGHYDISIGASTNINGVPKAFPAKLTIFVPALGELTPT